MSPSLPYGYVRFHGEPSIFYMALCRRCDLVLPFSLENIRQEWISEHAGAPQHSLADITKALDIRPAEGTTPMMSREP